MTVLNLLERISTTSALGLRFWDVATGTDVGSGLSVSAYAPKNPTRRITAYRTYSGRYAFRDLPGLRVFETRSDGMDFGSPLPPPHPTFVVEVNDSAGRFQPFKFTATVPVWGLFDWQCDQVSPLLCPDKTVPLYSAPARPVPGGMAVVRANLRDPIQNQPAAWAVLEASLQGQLLARGLADVQGRVLLFFGYPEPLTPESDSPPAGAQAPFTMQSWPLQFTARYGPLLPIPAVPDLCDALSQPVANLWANDASPPDPFAGDTLHYGQDLVLRSYHDASQTSPLAELHITPAGSPP
jgi:hypothetical protein